MPRLMFTCRLKIRFVWPCVSVFGLVWPFEARELKFSQEVRFDLLNCGCRGSLFIMSDFWSSLTLLPQEHICLQQGFLALVAFTKASKISI